MSMYSGHNIRTKRQELGWSAEKLARKIGVNKNNLYKWEKGHKPHDPEDYMKVKNWLESVPNATRGQEIAQESTNGDALTKSADKLTTSTKAPAFEMKATNGNSDKDVVIRNQSETVKTLADTSRSQQETISKLTDLVTKLVKE